MVTTGGVLVAEGFFSGFLSNFDGMLVRSILRIN